MGGWQWICSQVLWGGEGFDLNLVSESHWDLVIYLWVWMFLYPDAHEVIY